MFNRLLWVAALFSIVSLLMGANSAVAQHTGGGQSGGHGGSSSTSGSHSGSSGGHAAATHANGGNTANTAHLHGTHHLGNGYNALYPGVYFNNYYPGSAYSSFGNYIAPGVQYYLPDFYLPNYYLPNYYPAVPTYTPSPSLFDDYATVDVTVPDPQAVVLFDGAATSQTGAERRFHTPSLKKGSTYSYNVRASWMQNGQQVSQERTVSVTAGRSVQVQFTK